MFCRLFHRGWHSFILAHFFFFCCKVELGCTTLKVWQPQIASGLSVEKKVIYTENAESRYKISKRNRQRKKTTHKITTLESKFSSFFMCVEITIWTSNRRSSNIVKWTGNWNQRYISWNWCNWVDCVIIRGCKSFKIQILLLPCCKARV